MEAAAVAAMPDMFGDVGCVESKGKADKAYESLPDKADQQVVMVMTRKTKCETDLQQARAQ